MFMFVRVTADRSFLLGIRAVAYETRPGSDGTCREQGESSFPFTLSLSASLSGTEYILRTLGFF